MDGRDSSATLGMTWVCGGDGEAGATAGQPQGLPLQVGDFAGDGELVEMDGASIYRIISTHHVIPSVAEESRCLERSQGRASRFLGYARNDIVKKGKGRGLLVPGPF